MTINAWASASEMLAALRARQVSARELLDLHLRRIERFNPTVNAIVTPDYDEARRAAEATEAARARGEDGALLGLPLTIKDSIDVQGLRGTAGVPEFAERRPAMDSPLVARVRAAGGVIMGKTNVPTWLWDWQAINPIFGRTNNPWDISRSPGGSTGGGAAAVAAGLTPLEFGSDLAGSIRVPAAFCGIYGHRPSDTALPRSGHFPGGPLPDGGSIMGVLGPLARTADDLALAFEIVTGPEVDEAVAWRLDIPAPRHERLRDYRVAVLPPLPWAPVDTAILESQEIVIAALRDAGAQVAIAQPEGFNDLREHFRIYLALLHVFAGEGMPEAARRQQATELRARGDEIALAIADGFVASAADYLRWRGARERYRAAYRDFFRDWDVLLAPIIIVAAFPHMDVDIPIWERTLRIGGADVPYLLQMVYPAVATLSGQPATAFPVGFTHDGLPIGLQAIGPYLEDRTVIRFASLIGEIVGGFVPPPGYELYVEGSDPGGAKQNDRLGGRTLR